VVETVGRLRACGHNALSALVVKERTAFRPPASMVVIDCLDHWY
jgi:hypothetical protein